MNILAVSYTHLVGKQGDTVCHVTLHIERQRTAVDEGVPVVQLSLIHISFAAQRERWAIETDYVYPGPIQYFGPTEVCDQATKTLQLEQGK